MCQIEKEFLAHESGLDECYVYNSNIDRDTDFTEEDAIKMEEIKKLRKMIEDTYDDIFPENVNIATTEDIYEFRESCQNRINELEEE